MIYQDFRVYFNTQMSSSKISHRRFIEPQNKMVTPVQVSAVQDDLQVSAGQADISRLSTGRPSSLAESLEEVLKAGNYILLSQPDMKNISGPNGVFQLSCGITKAM